MGRTCFEVLDGILGDRPYLTGDSVSIADIMLGAQLDLFSECAEGRELLNGTPNLPAWLERMKARPSFAATQPPEFLREAA
jgi:glutathione S-transferase